MARCFGYHSEPLRAVATLMFCDQFSDPRHEFVRNTHDSFRGLHSSFVLGNCLLFRLCFVRANNFLTLALSHPFGKSLPGRQNVRTLVRVAAFEWDEAKAETNERKHGIRFSDETVSVFDDDQAITISDSESDPFEQRFITVGMSFMKRVIVVVYAYWGETVRIISARKATTHEEREYFGT